MQSKGEKPNPNKLLSEDFDNNKIKLTNSKESEAIKKLSIEDPISKSTLTP